MMLYLDNVGKKTTCQTVFYEAKIPKIEYETNCPILLFDSLIIPFDYWKM